MHTYFIAQSLINNWTGINSSRTAHSLLLSHIEACNPPFSVILTSLKAYKKWESSCIFFQEILHLLTSFMCFQYFALHQLVDLRDLVEPVMPDDWDKYFPDGVQNQYCMSMSQDQATD